jgi:hypothetical protein
MVTAASSADASIRIRPPCGVYFALLLSRFVRACEIRAGST